MSISLEKSEMWHVHKQDSILRIKWGPESVIIDSESQEAIGYPPHVKLEPDINFSFDQEYVFGSHDDESVRNGTMHGTCLNWGSDEELDASSESPKLWSSGSFIKSDVKKKEHKDVNKQDNITSLKLVSLDTFKTNYDSDENSQNINLVYSQGDTLTPYPEDELHSPSNSLTSNSAFNSPSKNLSDDTWVSEESRIISNQNSLTYSKRKSETLSLQTIVPTQDLQFKVITRAQAFMKIFTECENEILIRSKEYLSAKRLKIPWTQNTVVPPHLFELAFTSHTQAKPRPEVLSTFNQMVGTYNEIRKVRSIRWSQTDDNLVLYLKEVENLTWRESALLIRYRHSWQAVQMRYLRTLSKMHEPWEDEETERLKRVVSRDWIARWKRVTTEMGPQYSIERCFVKLHELANKKFSYDWLDEPTEDVSVNERVVREYAA